MKRGLRRRKARSTSADPFTASLASRICLVRVALYSCLPFSREGRQRPGAPVLDEQNTTAAMSACVFPSGKPRFRARIKFTVLEKKAAGCAGSIISSSASQPQYSLRAAPKYASCCRTMAGASSQTISSVLLSVSRPADFQRITSIRGWARSTLKRRLHGPGAGDQPGRAFSISAKSLSWDGTPPEICCARRLPAAHR